MPLTIMQTNQHTVFPNRAKADEIAATLSEIPHRVEEDPNGSGKCIIALLDDETGEFCTYL